MVTAVSGLSGAQCWLSGSISHSFTVNKLAFYIGSFALFLSTVIDLFWQIVFITAMLLHTPIQFIFIQKYKQFSEIIKLLWVFRYVCYSQCFSKPRVKTTRQFKKSQRDINSERDPEIGSLFLYFLCVWEGWPVDLYWLSLGFKIPLRKQLRDEGKTNRIWV